MTVKNRKKKKSGHGNRTAIIFWVSLLLLLVPASILGWVLISSWLDTGAPVLGDRYKDDLDPAITKSALSSVESGAKGVSGVDKAKVELATATLRVYADIDDNADADTAKSIAGNVYGSVTSILDPAVYFTQHDGKKMYDLEVHVYNRTERKEGESFVYVISTKTSSMAEPVTQLVSEPVNAELAQQLRDAAEAAKNPQPTAEAEQSNEITVGGEDVEQKKE